MRASTYSIRLPTLPPRSSCRRLFTAFISSHLNQVGRAIDSGARPRRRELSSCSFATLDPLGNASYPTNCDRPVRNCGGAFWPGIRARYCADPPNALSNGKSPAPDSEGDRRRPYAGRAVLSDAGRTRYDGGLSEIYESL